MTKRTTITIETKSLVVLRSRSSRRAWCPRCAADVEVIAIEPTNVSNHESAAIAQLLESDAVHRFTARDGSTLICLSSLLNHAQNNNPVDCTNPQWPKTEKEGT
jgi:hypothetical protein